MARAERLVKPLAVAIVALLVAGGVTVVRRRESDAGVPVTAHFSRTIGLYPGSSVRVLGVEVGTVTHIVPEGQTVLVRMKLKKGVKVPAEPTAVIIPPSLVSDRYVQLVPVYTSGPVLTDGADIPLARTRVPVELDDILKSLDRLFVALGPSGADADGSLGELIKIGAKALRDGGAQALNSTINELAGAVGALGDNREDLAGVLRNLSSFTSTLARNDTAFRRLTQDLGTVSQQLAAERRALEQALANLSVALGEIADLVRDHRGTLGRDIDSLAQVTKTVMKQKQSLIEALDVTPLVISNLSQVFNTERNTLDIRQDNEQGGQPYSIVFCQLLSPLLGIDCPPAPPGLPGKAGTASVGATRLDDSLMSRLSLAGMLGARS